MGCCECFLDQSELLKTRTVETLNEEDSFQDIEIYSSPGFTEPGTAKPPLRESMLNAFVEAAPLLSARGSHRLRWSQDTLGFSRTEAEDTC